MKTNEKILLLFCLPCLFLCGCLDIEARERVRKPFYLSGTTTSELFRNTGELTSGDFFNDARAPNIISGSLMFPFALTSDTILFPYDMYLVFKDEKSYRTSGDYYFHEN